MPAGPLRADPAAAAAHLKALAYAVGFDLVGITILGEVGTAPAFRDWVARGFSGTMDYLARGADKRADTRRVFEGSVSAVVVGMNHGGTQPPGPVARYARGRDYHDVMVDLLNDLLSQVREQVAPDVRGKPYVDTGPILERDLARQAGLGWIGKNTNLINPRTGSFFFLGSLFLDLPLAPDEPFRSDHCGTCTRCLAACPTDAFVAPRVLDATRCISYLTIEQRDAIPPAFHEGVGDLVFGCDICQDVCPWNAKFSRPLADGSPYATRPVLEGADARGLSRALLEMSPVEFAAAFNGSPMKRAKLKGLKRNAAVVLGNVGTAGDREALQRATTDPEPVVRAQASLALQHLEARTAT